MLHTLLLGWIRMDIMIFPKIASAVVAVALVVIPASVYFQNRREPASKERHSPGLYGCGIALTAFLAYSAGVPVGIGVACSSPGAGNLCGLAGFFVYGPIFAAVAAVVTPLALWIIVKRAAAKKSAEQR